MSRKPDNISQDAWDAVDSPPLTERMLRGMRPAREVLRPALFEKLTKVRGPQKAPTKEAISLRLDRDVLDHFRAMGEGWQTRINDVLRESAKAAGTDVKNPPKKTLARSAASGAFTTKTAAAKTPKAMAKEAAGSALTQGSGRTSSSTRGVKKRAK